jgi:hypothetical protein
VSHIEDTFYDNILGENILTRLEKKHVEEGKKTFEISFFFQSKIRKFGWQHKISRTKRNELKDCLRTVAAAASNLISSNILWIISIIFN